MIGVSPITAAHTALIDLLVRSQLQDLSSLGVSLFTRRSKLQLLKQWQSRTHCAPFAGICQQYRTPAVLAGWLETKLLRAAMPPGLVVSQSSIWRSVDAFENAANQKAWRLKASDRLNNFHKSIHKLQLKVTCANELHVIDH